MTWKTQFPTHFDVPWEVTTRAEVGLLRDTSWGNDTCPSFEIDPGVTLWVEHPDPDCRESGGNRFTVAIENDEGDIAIACETDRMADLDRYLADHWDI